MIQLMHNSTYQDLLEKISHTYMTGRNAALMDRLSADLCLRYGKWFSRGNACTMPILGT